MELMLLFGTAPYDDSFGKLCKLWETSTERESQSHFKMLMGKAGVLTDEQETTCFISGLKEPLQADVRAQHLNTLSSAIALAHIYEGKILEVKKSYVESKPNLF